MNSRILTVLPLLCQVLASAYAQDTPVLEQPEQRALLSAALVERAKWQADTDTYFRMPLSGIPIPCAAAETTIKEGLGLIDRSKDPKWRGQMARINRSAGLLANYSSAPRVADVRFVLLKGTCTGDAPHGEFEAFVDYKVILDTADFVMTSHLLTRVGGRFAATGEQRPPDQVVSTRTLGSKTEYKDPANAARMTSRPGSDIRRDSFGSFGRNGSVTVRLTSIGSVPPSVSTEVVSSRQDGDDVRTVMRIYEGRVLTTEVSGKNDLPHGRFRIFPHRNTQFGFDVPGEEHCFEEGEMLKTKTCDVR